MEPSSPPSPGPGLLPASPPPPMPGDLAGLPAVIRPPLSAAEHDALVTWGFLEHAHRDDWSLPVRWSVTAELDDVGGYGAYRDRAFLVTDPDGVPRFRVSEQCNPAGTRSRVEMLRLPKYVYTLRLVVLKTGELLTSHGYPDLEHVNAQLREPIPSHHFCHAELYRELGDQVDGQATVREVVRSIVQ